MIRSSPHRTLRGLARNYLVANRDRPADGNACLERRAFPRLGEVGGVDVWRPEGHLWDIGDVSKGTFGAASDTRGTFETLPASRRAPSRRCRPENGCLYFLPGTHRTGRHDNVAIGEKIGALFDVYPEWRGIDPVAAPMRAGSVAFHNGLTAHAAGANVTARPRRAMTLRFMPAGATYNGTPHDIVLPRRGVP